MTDRDQIIDEIEAELETAIISLDAVDKWPIREAAMKASQIGTLLNNIQFRLRFLRDQQKEAAKE